MSDEPFDEIIRYSEDEDIDLIVMGTHGRARSSAADGQRSGKGGPHRTLPGVDGPPS
jgi:hypothetical protein